MSSAVITLHPNAFSKWPIELTICFSSFWVKEVGLWFGESRKWAFQGTVSLVTSSLEIELLSVVLLSPRRRFDQSFPKIEVMSHGICALLGRQTKLLHSLRLIATYAAIDGYNRVLSANSSHAAAQHTTSPWNLRRLRDKSANEECGIAPIGSAMAVTHRKSSKTLEKSCRSIQFKSSNLDCG